MDFLTEVKTPNLLDNTSFTVIEIYGIVNEGGPELPHAAGSVT